jgi:Na+/melibiose symporter-like transporter
MIPFAVFFIALFSIPSLFRENSEVIKVLIVLLVYMIYILVYTLVCIPYNTVISDMTDDYDERTSFTTWRMTVSIMATLLSIVIPEILGLSTLNQNSGVSLLVLGLIFGSLIIILGLIAGFGIKERRVADRGKVPFSFQKYFFHSFRSHHFRKVCIMYFCSFACLAAINVSLLYFLNYNLLLPALLVPIGGGVMVLAIIVLPLWNYLCRKIGKKESQMLAAIILGISLFTLIFIPVNKFFIQPAADRALVDLSIIDSLKRLPVWTYFSIIFLSIGFSGLQMIPSSIVPDAINFTIADDLQDEGAYYGVVNFVFKIGNGIVGLIIGWVLELSGYRNPPKDLLANEIFLQPETAKMGIIIVFAGLPILLALISFISMFGYDITREKLNSLIHKA